MWDERNTGSNLLTQIEIYADTKPGHELEYELFFMAKGGGSANKSYLFQETKAVLNRPDSEASSTRSCGPLNCRPPAVPPCRGRRRN